MDIMDHTSEKVGDSDLNNTKLCHVNGRQSAPYSNTSADLKVTAELKLILELEQRGQWSSV